MKIKLLAIFIGLLTLWTSNVTSGEEVVEMPASLYGSEPLGTLVWPNGHREPLTWRDIWWLSKTADYEGGGSQPIESASVIWTYAQRRYFGTGPNVSPNFRDWSWETLIRLHSQPVNPRWAADGEFCRPGGRNAGSQFCAPELLARRRRAVQATWSELSPISREAAIAFATGRLPNPVPGSIDFADASLGLHSGFRVVRDGNNLFQGSPQSIAWGGRGLYVEPPSIIGTSISNLVPFGSYFSKVL